MAPLDTVIFGNAASELDHGIASTLSSTVVGALGQSARVLDQSAQPGFWGGTTKFSVAVSPSRTTYLSVKLWGGDFSAAADESENWRLQLFIDGKSVGWLDEGPVDSIDQLGVDPRSPERFFLHTVPLPEVFTKGKHSVEVELRSMGRIWSYGGPTNFFYNQTSPSRPIYRAYSHDAGYFAPASDDPFGSAPILTPRPNVDADTVAKVRARVLNDQQRLLYGGGALQMDAWGFNALAEGYAWKDGPAYKNADALAVICQGIDGRYNAWKSDAKVLTSSDQQWQGFGRVGLVLSYLWENIQSELDKNVTTGQTTLINPGFELGDTTPLGWHAQGWANHGTLARDTTVTHSGSASAKLASDGGALVVGPNGRTQVGQGQFTVSCWMKTDGTDTASKIDVLFWDANGKLAGTDHNFYPKAGATDWQSVGGTFTVPPGAVEFEIWVVAVNGRTAWFDDLSFSGPAPIPAKPVGRRAAYRDMLLSSRDYWKANARHYSNQAQICAIGIYQANRGLSLLSPTDAWPESRARMWIHESIGLKPFLGSELADGTRTKPLGDDYYVVAPSGITRELGFVGSYGEVTDWLVMMYESITRGYAAVNAPEVREQMIKMVKARGHFRIIDADVNGHRVARVETVIGWRNEAYPGGVAYAGRTVWDSSPVMAAAAFNDPALTGWTQEMVADGQFGPALGLMLTNSSNRVSLNATRMIARDLPAFLEQPASSERLPVGWDQPDFVLTDEVNGAIAVKNGKELFFASLYWRARQGVNDLGRVHLVTPEIQRSATIRQETAGLLSNDSFTVQDWATWDYAINDATGGPSPVQAGGWTPPGPPIHQAFAGEILTKAVLPSGVDPTFGSPTLGTEEALSGKAPFYRLEYGRYIVGMNTSKDQTFNLTNSRYGQAVLLGAAGASGQKVDTSSPLTVPPMSTVILYIDDQN